MQFIVYKPRRTDMVGDIHQKEKWITNTEDSNSKPENSYSCGRIRQWIENSVRDNHQIKTLEPRRERVLNNRSRTQVVSFYDSILCKKL